MFTDTNEPIPQDFSDGDSIDLGFVHVERVGRELHMRSDLDAESHVEQMKRLSALRPDLKASIDEKLRRLRGLFTKNDPLQTLSHVAASNLFGDPEAYKETTHEGSESAVELVMSLATSLQFPEHAPLPDHELIDECIRLSREIPNDCFWYYGSEIAEKGDQGVSSEIRQILLGKALQMRGDGYWVHLRQTFLEIYSPLNDDLSKMLGFSALEFLETLERAEEEINNKVNSSLSKARPAFDLAMQDHEMFNQWSSENDERFETVDDMIAAFKSEHPQVEKNAARLFEALAGVTTSDLFGVIPRDDIESKVFDAISMGFGDNVGFWENLPSYRGWPLNESLIHRKPVIRHDGKYYFFHLPLTLRSVTRLLAAVALERVGQGLHQRLLTRRDAYLEANGIDLISRVLEGCVVYRNLYFPSSSADSGVWFETDGIVVYGGALLIIEGKAGRLSSAALRGGLLSLATGLGEIVGVANQQGLNVLSYLNSNESVTFYDERRTPVVTLARKDFTRVFIINVTLEQLDVLVTHLSWVSDLGIIPERDWPWVVNLNDLRVIAEVLDHPSQFIHYLVRRLRANDVRELHAFDELDLFMMYLKQDLYWEGTEPEEGLHIVPIGYTEELDSYYLYREGKRPQAPKPRQSLPDDLSHLITLLETGKPSGFVEGCLALYDCDEQTRIQISNQIDRVNKASLAATKPSSVGLVFEASQSALLIGVLPTYSISTVKAWADRYHDAHDVKTVVAISWEPPMGQNTLKVDQFEY